MDPIENAGDSDITNDELDTGSKKTVDSGDIETKQDGPQSSLEAMKQALDIDEDANDGQHDGEDKKKDEDKEKKADEGEGKKDGKDKDAGAITDEELIAPLPEDAKKETRERFEKLADSYKELKQRVETFETETTQLKQDVGDFQELIKYSGATPQEFNQLVEYSHKVKSGDLEGALALLDEQRLALAQVMGKPLPGIDLLSDYPDLQKKVSDMDMDEETALELAAARNKRAADEKSRQAHQAQQQHEQETEAQTERRFAQAQQNIVTLANSWAAKDIDYPAKHEKLMAKAKEIAQSKPPELWGDAMELYYQSLSDLTVNTAQDSNTNTDKNKHRPLRPGGGAGGESVPKTSLEAMQQRLGYN